MNIQHHRLWGMRCYLIGAMDRAPDNGKGWRQRITPFLQRLGIVVLNPCNKPIDAGRETPADKQRHCELRKRRKYDEYAREIKQLRVIDLRMVDMSDLLIVNIDTNIHACGTYEETSWANRLKNPILIHCEQGKQGIPGWMFGVIPHQHMFDNWVSICQYLWTVHTADTVKTYNRWMFFNYETMVPQVTPKESCFLLSGAEQRQLYRNLDCV